MILLTIAWNVVKLCFVCCRDDDDDAAKARLHISPKFLIKVPLCLQQDKDKEENNVETGLRPCWSVLWTA